MGLILLTFCDDYKWRTLNLPEMNNDLINFMILNDAIDVNVI